MQPSRVILTEGQTLTKRHQQLLERFLVRSEWEIVTLPPQGPNRAQIAEILRSSPPPTAIIFASYDPLLLALFCRRTDQPIFLFYPNEQGSLDITLV